MAIGMAMVVDATSSFELYASAIMMGASVSVGTLSMFTLAVSYYGRTAYPPLMGVIGLFLALAPSIMAVAAGAVFDHFGSYALAFYTEAGLCVLAALMMPFAVPGKQPVEQLKPA
jgi:hypothetical protein